jgi:hypothetical protein
MQNNKYDIILYFFRYKMRQFGILTVAKQSIHQLQTQAGAEEFQKQIAALTIQLAWRKYYR